MQIKSFLILGCCCAFLVLGCTTEPRKNTVAGTVDLDGAPLAEGDITFVPKGEGRPAGGVIRDGKYAVQLEKGTYEVKILATKKVPVAPGEATASGEKDKLVSIIPEKYNEKTELTVTVDGDTKKDFPLSTK